MDIIISLILSLLTSILKVVIKDPKSVAVEGKVVAEIAQYATQADTLVNGSTWSYTPPSTPVTTA
jgi:hypothetical protein